MFEKEAEEYAQGRGHEHYHFLFEENAGNPVDFAKLCYKDGYQDGLNSNRWHYPSKGEYPTEGKTVFATFQEGGLWYFAEAEYHEGGWASSIVDLGNIVAWQYIIPPKIENLKCRAKVTIKATDNNNIEGERKNDKL